MFTRNELIEALKIEGLQFDEKCDFSEGGQIKWESKFEEIEEMFGETGFAPEMACDITDEYIDFCSILNTATIHFNKDFAGHPTLDEVVEETKRIVTEFYRDL